MQRGSFTAVKGGMAIKGYFICIDRCMLHAYYTAWYPQHPPFYSLGSVHGAQITSQGCESPPSLNLYSICDVMDDTQVLSDSCIQTDEERAMTTDRHLFFNTAMDDDIDRQLDRLNYIPRRRTASPDKHASVPKLNYLDRKISTQKGSMPGRPADTVGQVGNSFDLTHTWPDRKPRQAHRCCISLYFLLYICT